MTGHDAHDTGPANPGRGESEKLAARVHRLRRLNELTRLVSASLDIESVLREISKAAVELMGAHLASFWLCDETTRTLHVKAFSDAAAGADSPVRVVAFGAGLIGWVAANRHTLTVADVFTDERVIAAEWWRHHGLTSFVGVPVMLEDRLLAVLAMSAARPVRLDADDEELLGSFVGHAAVALRNAQLFRSAQEARAHAEASERALRESEKLVTAIVDTEPACVKLVAPDGTLRTMNRAGLALLEAESLGQVVGQPLARFVCAPDQPAFQALFMRVLDGESGTLAFDMIGLKGTKRRLESHAVPFRDAQDAITAVLAVTVDITELQQREEKIVQLQKLEAVGRLAGGVAHDFNNLLTVMIGRSEIILARRDGVAQATRRDVELIRDTADRAAALTQQLLAFSRKQVLQPRVLDLNAVIASMATMLRRLIPEDIDLIIEASQIDRVRADRSQIEQVVTNLVANARDAMRGGGRLTMKTSNVTLDDAFVRLHPGASAGAHVVLAISDTGTGLDAATRALIFEPFFTTKDVGAGTGLGLATVYGIVKQHNGYVEVDSTPGAGSTFRVYLPATSVALDRVEPAGDTDTRGGTETILLVEDEKTVRDLAEDALRAGGYTVLTSATGAEALVVFERHPTRIHLLVTDVVMPHMAGPELAERLRRQRPDLKVLYITGYTEDAIIHRGVADTGSTLLRKPFGPGRLRQAVREVLDAVH